MSPRRQQMEKSPPFAPESGEAFGGITRAEYFIGQALCGLSANADLGNTTTVQLAVEIGLMTEAYITAIREEE